MFAHNSLAEFEPTVTTQFLFITKAKTVEMTVKNSENSSFNLINQAV